MNRIIIAYGEMGVGKNYVGERLADELGVKFIDGDSLLPPSMIEKVNAFKPFTLAEIENFVKVHLTPAILREAKNGVVVAQALYRQEHRDHIARALALAGFKAEFALISTGLLTHLSRLWSRPRGFLWMMYGLINKPFFQVGLPNIVIDNGNNLSNLLEQIDSIVFN